MALQPINREQGDQLSEVYLGERSDSETQRVTRERVEWMCREAEGPRVMDVGCSQGMTSTLVARQGLFCVGVDVSRDGLAYAENLKRKGSPEVKERLSFVSASCFELPFNGDYFDSCLLGEVLEHLECPRECLAETARVLKPGGKAVITVPFGQLPHPDHKRVYHFTSFLAEVEAFFDPVSMDLVDKRIRFVGRLRSSAPDAKHDSVDKGRLLEKAELFIDALEASKEGERLRLNMAFEQRKEALEERDRALEQLDRLENGEGLYRLLREVVRKRMSRAEKDIKKKGLGRTLVKCFRKACRLSPKLMTACFRVLKRILNLLREERVCKKARVTFSKRLADFVEKTNKHDSKRVVVIFSGTREIKEIYGNRPMRQTRILLEGSTPVLFSYYRWSKADRLAESNHPLLLQSPIDFTMEFFSQIMQADLPGKEKIFIVSFPHPFIVRRLNELHTWGWRTIYDVRDNWGEFAVVGAARWYDQDVERYVVNNVEACCCVAAPLRDKIQGFTTNKTVHLNPNAFDVLFLKPENRGRVAPRKGPKIVGYFGHLTPAWFDWKRLNAVARLLPEWTFEVVGRDAEGHGDLERNICLSGPKSHAELNEITQRWRVAMIPFKMGPLADGVDPIKIYEYLAMGLPTVSFRMPQIHEYPYVFPVYSVEEFAEKIVEASEVSIDREAIDMFLSANTWEIRVDEMLSLLMDPELTPCDLQLLNPGGGNS